DVGHYLSIPNLVTYMLFGRWVIWPALASAYPISFLARMISPDVSVKKSGAIFFVLHKPAGKQ
ncbi:MAG: hypothetical protein AAB276_06645, partial [Pseudomonadota bacterium]